MIVFPMAGRGQRFLGAGISSPKYMLPIGGATCFDLSVCSIVSGLPDASVVFVVQAEQEAVRFVGERLRALGLSKARLVVLNQATAGQAETVEKGIEGIHEDDPEGLVIFNIDTFRLDFTLPAEAERCDGFIETFEAEGTHWSFVEDDGLNTGRVARTTEKVRVSNNCCTGLYQFARIEDFRRSLQAERRHRTAGELYVAPLYNHLIRQGRDIRYRSVPSGKVACAGTPEEYELLIEKWGRNGAPEAPPIFKEPARTGDEGPGMKLSTLLRRAWPALSE